MLYQHELNAVPLPELYEDFWCQNPEHSADVKSFSELLVRGTVTNLEHINQIISKYAENWQLSRMAVIDRSILRFATFELLYCDDIPPKVTINEAVNIAKKFSQEDSGKFVNGILDKISHSETTKDPSPSEADSL